MHKRWIETDENGDEISSGKLLGFFSSQSECENAKREYIKQPGFRDYPDCFIVEKVYADVDDYNDDVGDFDGHVYYLAHEWFDGTYDHITEFGCYSTEDKAKQAQKTYQFDADLIDHPNGWSIDDYVINKRWWTEGFFIWESDEHVEEQ